MLRVSPYLSNNLLKYMPSAIIPDDGSTTNHLPIDNKISLGGVINYQNYRPE